MNKSAQEYMDLLDEIESEMVFDINFFTKVSKKRKLIDLINQRMEYPEIG